MAISILDQELLHYFSRLNDPQKRSLLEMIRTFINAAEEDTFDSVSAEQYNKESDEAVAKVEAGEFYTHEEVVEMSKSWINERK